MSAKILLVEDDAFLRDGLCEMLEKEGYGVKVCVTKDAAGKITSIYPKNVQ